MELKTSMPIFSAYRLAKPSDWIRSNVCCSKRPGKRWKMPARTHISLAYSQSGMMAADGRCKFGDARGDGYVRSEGAGVVVLKSVDRALADGDRIYAVIRGSAVNNDGSGGGSLGTPSRSGQEELL